MSEQKTPRITKRKIEQLGKRYDAAFDEHSKASDQLDRLKYRMTDLANRTENQFDTDTDTLAATYLRAATLAAKAHVAYVKAGRVYNKAYAEYYSTNEVTIAIEMMLEASNALKNAQVAARIAVQKYDKTKDKGHAELSRMSPVLTGCVRCFLAEACTDLPPCKSPHKPHRIRL